MNEGIAFNLKKTKLVVSLLCRVLLKTSQITFFFKVYLKLIASKREDFRDEIVKLFNE